MSEYPYLFSPLKIGSTIIPNRINFAAHLTNLSENHQISDAHIHYYMERANGGCGLITTEELTVHPSDLAYAKLVDAFVPEVIPGFLKLTRAIHGTDTKIFAQLNHNGMQADGKISRLPVWGPSPGKDPLFREMAKAMEIEDIRECIAYFAKSARYVVEGGFDGIELQLGHSSLIRQFLSPASNFREDEYGGSFDNRLRFCLEVIAAVRKTIGNEFTLGVRLNADEMHPKGGLTHRDAKKVAKCLDDAGLIDFINISLGTFHNLFLVEGSMHTPLAYTTPLSAGIRSVVNLPVYATNRINDPHLAEKILENGQGDMVNMVRALIADPDLPNKARYGKSEDIRHCIACNQGCIGRMGMGYTIGCMQTPCAGNEQTLGKGTLSLCDVPKKVVIIGAGPAGLEAARVAALRKHQVILFDKNDAVGGQNLIAAKAAGRQEIQGVTRWLSSQVNKLDIDVRLGCRADAEMILRENPDAIVVATGSTPKNNPFPGQYQFPQVVNSIQILTGQVMAGPAVLVIDLNGHHHGTGTAEFLANQGRKVHMLVPSLFPGSALGPLQDLFLTSQRLARKGVTCTPDIAVLEIQGTLVKGLNVYSNEMIDFEGYDTIVCIAGNMADDRLYFELKDTGKEIYRIGDCLAPRLTDSAITDGHRIGRRL
ncbi:mycofactocin system FadH/OYE family oxidoreductase 2 [Desulfobacula sp.]|uniref:mycofactocin system FadH/OYE family oxidoreductase 2 n=1 Tax=Desulfobacula sp. TaxID=2593537 RepID=UPI0026348003|nr:mycofactocin system FadH/OYE family oxidoreductase 2 [Desulfobacula sp.]